MLQTTSTREISVELVYTQEGVFWVLRNREWYSLGMGDEKKLNFDDDGARVLEEEDEKTLAAIDRGIKAADEGRVVPLEEVRQRMKQWATEFSSPKKR